MSFNQFHVAPSFYKIISKILTTLLNIVMDQLIDGSQATFIQGRSIVDNIHLAQELLLHYTRKYISPRCALKVDLQKAYDIIHWDSIREAMTWLLFPGKFIGRITECVTTTSFSTSIKGQLHGFFQGARGLHSCLPFAWRD